MASSGAADRKGKSVPQQKYLPSLEDGIVLSPNPISSHRPENTSQVNVVEYSGGHWKRELKGSKRLFERHVSFSLSKEEADYVSRMDEVIRANVAAGENYSWVPLPVRLAGWTIEFRQRLDKSQKIEPFFHHPHVSRVLRSIKNVLHYICYGSVPPPEKGKIKKSLEAEDEPPSKRIKTQKEFVEAFLAQSYSNLMNRAPCKNDEAQSSSE